MGSIKPPSKQRIPVAPRSSNEVDPPPSSAKVVQRWTMSHVSPADRLDYYASVVSEALIPVGTDNAEPGKFDAEATFTQLDAIGVFHATSAPHSTFRGASEIARSDDRRFNLMMSVNCAWNVEHRGAQRVQAGDVFLHDSAYPLWLDVRSKCTGINFSVTEEWLRRWIPSPGEIVGYRIPRDSAWGRALASYMTALTPEVISVAPIPESVLADQIGGLLALATAERRPTQQQPLTPALQSLKDRIVDCIRQRCIEPSITAVDVASSLGISVRTLHRALGAAGVTFGTLLIDERVRTATRLLQSPIFKRVTTAEISRRAGFQSPSHFVRVFRKRTGFTPLEVRRTVM